MTALGVVLIGLPFLLFGYAYLGYPGVLLLMGAFRRPGRRLEDPPEWPRISLTVPAYNEERSIRGMIESLLNLQYPLDRCQILIISDASTDHTDDIVREYGDCGVELLRMATRGGKTAAENAAGALLTGSIVVNTDATIRILPGSLKALIRVFQDPTVGVASGRDISVGDVTVEGNRGESGYVGYEMWLRSLETHIGSIVGASGCFYAIRRELHETLFPEALSRDFACALIAKEHGFRAVSVDEAICLVPRTASLRKEFRRKVRTMARGLETLWYKRHLMNPWRYGLFSWMVVSHKLCRWLVFPAMPLGVIGLALLGFQSPIAAAAFLVALSGIALGVIGMSWPEGRRPPAPIALCGFVVGSTVAAWLAWYKALRGERNPIWEPTRRPT